MDDQSTSLDLDTLPERLETASAHVATNVAVVAPDALAGEVRESLVGRRWDCLADLAVCADPDPDAPGGRRLVGLLSIEGLMAAPASVRVGEMMDQSPPVVGPGVDQEVAAWTMVRAGESSLAVVDDQGSFVGLIAPATLGRVLLEEHDEDLARFGGVLRSAASARTASDEEVRRRLWHRVPWLALGLLGAMGSAALVAGFEDALERTVALAFFLPAIVYMADAVGTQTETLAVRGLSVGVPIRQIVGKELATGGLIGALIAVLFFVFGLALQGDAELALVVSVSLFAACSTASVVALALPWVLNRFGTDPAFGSGPVATVIQDVLSLLIYFAVATVVLG